MVYSLKTVLRMRMIALIIVRVLGIAYLFFEVIPTFSIIVYMAIWDLYHYNTGRGYVYSDYQDHGAAIVPHLLLIVAIFLLDRRIVRWLIPMPRWACPGCGYELSEARPIKCPECGVALAGPATSTGQGA